MSQQTEEPKAATPGVTGLVGHRPSSYPEYIPAKWQYDNAGMHERLVINDRGYTYADDDHLKEINDPVFKK